MAFLIFFIFWFTLLALSHWYVGRRILNALSLTPRERRLGWFTVALIFAVPQIPFLLLVNGVESPVQDVVSWFGYVVLGFFSLVLTGIFLRDILLVLDALARKLTARSGGNRNVDRQRRQFLVHATNLGVIGLAAVSSGYGLYEARRRAMVENVNVPIMNLPGEFDGFRIVQFTDLHIGPTIKRQYVEGIVGQVHELKPDLVVFTGDLVDGSVPWLKDDVAPLRELSAPHGVYFVTGNHEYYSGVGPWVKEAGRLGFDVLLNEHRVLERGSGRLVLAGVTDHVAGDFTPDLASDPKAAVRNAPEGPPRILLAHQPRSIFPAEAAGYALQISGHTHGGQFFPWNYLATLNQPYISGLHKHGPTWVYVSRGTGYWGPPLRLGIPPEVTVITLRQA